MSVFSRRTTPPSRLRWKEFLIIKTASSLCSTNEQSIPKRTSLSLFIHQALALLNVTTTSAMDTGSSHGGEFSRVLTDFTSSLTEEQQNDFRFSTLEDLQAVINGIQKKQCSERRMQNLTRLRSFLEAMDQYGKVIEVFLSSSAFIAFIWV
jgi:hypothetical protein